MFSSGQKDFLESFVTEWSLIRYGSAERITGVFNRKGRAMGIIENHERTIKIAQELLAEVEHWHQDWFDLYEAVRSGDMQLCQDVATRQMTARIAAFSGSGK